MNASDQRRPETRQVEELREALDVYLSGRSGIRFDALARFAGPLFDLYEVRWRAEDGVDSLRRDRDELATMVALLDAARLFWSFFALDDDGHVTALPDLEDALLGTRSTDEERSNLLVLLSLLEEHWQLFSPEERAAAARTPGYALPPFEVLLSEFTDRNDSVLKVPSQTYGPEFLELPEALALFAQPLLRDPAVASDPDQLEERIARAQAYWDLAQTDSKEYEKELDRIAASFAQDGTEQDEFRREAAEMVARYNELFAARGAGPSR